MLPKVSAVFARLGHVLLILALLAATGGHWAVLQTVAWTNMLATNLRTDSLEVALTKTFDGQHPCKLCKVVADGKKSEKSTDLPALAKKIEFTHGATHFLFTAPENFWLQDEPATVFHSVTHLPSVPPPRGFLS